MNTRYIPGSEYEELLPGRDLEKRREYWDIAKGLQKTDNLITSNYLESVISDTTAGKFDTEKAVQKVSEYYKDLSADDPEKASEEADKVAARIVAFLERESFRFSPVQLKSIHKELFQDMKQYNPGRYRSYNISKNEEVLGGDSVRYGDYDDIEELLSYDFSEEERRRYSIPFSSSDIENLCRFTLKIWETHPFCEGNTRTVSTFMIKYLRSMGAEINNDPFKTNAKWFRDALVRANYYNVDKGIDSDASFLQMFFENILIDAGHKLESIDLHV